MRRRILRRSFHGRRLPALRLPVDHEKQRPVLRNRLRRKTRVPLQTGLQRSRVRSVRAESRTREPVTCMRRALPTPPPSYHLVIFDFVFEHISTALVLLCSGNVERRAQNKLFVCAIRAHVDTAFPVCWNVTVPIPIYLLTINNAIMQP